MANKKILIISILAVLTLVTISYASAMNNNNTTQVEKKESPLYKIRTRSVIREKINQILEHIKTKFLGERIFFIPYKFEDNRYKSFLAWTKIENGCTLAPKGCWTIRTICGVCETSQCP